MNVLVIGGTRYMGRHMVQSLIEQGDDVTVFTRGNTKPDWWGEVKHITGDRNNIDEMREALKGKQFDAVIDTQAYRKEDVESANEILEGNAGRYQIISSASVYFDGYIDFWMSCPVKPEDVNWKNLDYSYPENEQPYNVGKRHCEKWLQENAKIPYTILRVPSVMGWDDPTGRMWWWLQRAMDGGGIIIPSDARGIFQTLYVEDAANALVDAVKSSSTLNRTYNIDMKEIMSAERWSRIVWGAAGHEAKITYVPGKVITKQDGLAEYANPLVADFPYAFDVSDAERDFGFKTTPVEEWIEKTFKWYSEQYKGEDSYGYEHRREELDLADRWMGAYDSFIESF